MTKKYGTNSTDPTAVFTVICDKIIIFDWQNYSCNIKFQNCPVNFADTQFWGPGLLALALFLYSKIQSKIYKCHLMTHPENLNLVIPFVYIY